MEQRKIKQNKIENVKSLEKYMEENQGIAFFENKGINANEINDIRRKAKENKVQIIVSKNTFWKIALKKFIKNTEDFNLKGKTIAFVAENAINAVGFNEFLSKSEQKFLIPKAIMDKSGLISDEKKVLNISKTKNLQGMIVSLIFTAQFPLFKLIKILNILKDR
jgi:ribosomal protein L10